MRVLGWVLAAVLVLPFVKAAAQLAAFGVIGLALLFALKNPQEALGCAVLVVLIGLTQPWPGVGLAILSGLIALGLLPQKSR